MLMLESDLERFSSITVSKLSDHGTECCTLTRSIVRSKVASAELSRQLGMIPEVVKWAPIRWPAFWCDLEAPGGELQGDCGVHAALATDLLKSAGVPCSQVQIAICCPANFRSHWAATWATTDIAPLWIGETHVYHEVVGVYGSYWDPSEARWFEGVGDCLACGVVVAIRDEGSEWRTH